MVKAKKAEARSCGTRRTVRGPDAQTSGSPPAKVSRELQMGWQGSLSLIPGKRRRDQGQLVSGQGIDKLKGI